MGGSLHPLFFPPLLGFAYLRWRDGITARAYGRVVLWFLYTLLFETVWNLPLFLLGATMVLMYRIVEPGIVHFLRRESAIRLALALSINLLYGSVLFLISDMFNQTWVHWHPILLYDLGIDLLVVGLFG